jgi:hypothetical protein
MRRLLLSFTALAFGFLGAISGVAAAQVEAGRLTCDVSAGLGMIIASQKTVRCTFERSPLIQPPAHPEYYTGSIRKFGVDIGGTTSGQMIWAVYAPTNAIGTGALAGVYAGATAEATVAVGLGANVLVGGSNRTIALQPLSVTGQTGLNIAAGVASLELQPSP